MEVRSGGTTKFSDGRRRRRTNFESPFTPRTQLRSPRNFGNTRFRRFANFDCLTPKKFFGKNFGFFFGFSLFSADFRGARLFLTSKSNSSRFFALDGQIFRSVRRLGLIFRFSPFVHRPGRGGEAKWGIRNQGELMPTPRAGPPVLSL